MIEWLLTAKSTESETLLYLKTPCHAAACGQFPPEFGVRGPKCGMPDKLDVAQRAMARYR